MMKKILIIFLTLSAMACNRDYMSLAKVNGDSISIGDFKSRLQEIQFDPKLVAEDELMNLKKSILNEMIEEKIIEQESKKTKLKVTDEDVKAAMDIEHLDEMLKKQSVDKNHWIHRMKQKILAEKLFQEITQSIAKPSEAEIQEFFSKNE
ncbi:MAG: SurA N-terminal domain-containing protein, partial [Bdellovibrionota bacterium]